MVGPHDQTLRLRGPRKVARLAFGQSRACHVCLETSHQGQSKALVGGQPTARSPEFKSEGACGGTITIKSNHQVTAHQPTIRCHDRYLVAVFPDLSATRNLAR